MKIQTTDSYNEIGPQFTITVQLDYEDLRCFKYPDSCISCPAGFSETGKCGKNTSLRSSDSTKRPKNCKLRRIDVTAYDEYDNDLDYPMWRNIVCRKYGDGKHVLLSEIPLKDLLIGAILQRNSKISSEGGL